MTGRMLVLVHPFMRLELSILLLGLEVGQLGINKRTSNFPGVSLNVQAGRDVGTQLTATSNFPGVSLNVQAGRDVGTQLTA